MKRREFIHQTTGLGVVVAAGALPGSFLSVIPPVSIETSNSKLTPPPKGKIPVAFAISEGVTVIDFAGPWEVFQDVHVSNRGTDHEEQAPSRATITFTTNPASVLSAEWLWCRSTAIVSAEPQNTPKAFSKILFCTQGSFENEDSNTPKALANSSPAVGAKRQPWGEICK